MFAALLNFDFSSLMWIAIAVVGFLVMSRVMGPAAAVSALTTLAPRAMNLMRFIDSLGLPVLGPLLKAVGEARWKDVPAAFHGLFDQLDDKEVRRGILAQFAKRQLNDQLSDPTKREALLVQIESTLGVKIPRESTS